MNRPGRPPTGSNKLAAHRLHGRLLLALRAGLLSADQIYERFGNYGSGALKTLVRDGLIEHGPDGYYRLSAAGRTACPCRNPIHQTMLEAAHAQPAA